MTRFLHSDTNPDGYRLEDILGAIRTDVLTRAVKIAPDDRPEAMHVMANNVKILEHLTQAIALAQDSTKLLDRAFGPSHSEEGGPPRIGVA